MKLNALKLTKNHGFRVSVAYVFLWKTANLKEHVMAVKSLIRLGSLIMHNKLQQTVNNK